MIMNDATNVSEPIASKFVIWLLATVARAIHWTRLLAIPSVREFVMKVYQSFLYPMVLCKIFRLKHITVRIHGHRFHVPLYNSGGLGIIAFGGTLDPYMIHLFERVIRPGMTVVDVGAYIGYYTLIAAQLVGEEGKVFTFEPDPDNYSYLTGNIKANGYNNIIPVPKAVSDHTGTSTFFVDLYDSTCHSLYPILRRSGVKKMSVECVPLDDVLMAEPVQVIKIDVEGAELAALRGMRQVLACNRKLTLFVELQPKNLERGGITSSELLQFLKEQGFETFLIDEKKCALQPISQATLLEYRCQREQNLLCIREGNIGDLE